MKKIDKYYMNTKDLSANENIIKFLEIIENKKEYFKNIIELGCGAGRDTKYLLHNGFNVTAIDRENVEEIIINEISEEDIKRFQFHQKSFEELEFLNLTKSDILVSNFSIPFCEKSIFKNTWNNIVNNIRKEGYFVGNFFGKEDSWNFGDTKIIFLEEKEVRELFEDFEIIYFNEKKKKGITGIGREKFWHIYEVIAIKRK